MAKSKRQKQRASQRATPRPTSTPAPPRRVTGNRSSGQSITVAAEQAKRRQELMKWLGTGLLLAIFAVVAVIVINSRDDGGGANSNGNVATVEAAAPIPEGVQQNGTVLGDPNAPVLIVEYGDYQCPFCKRFAINDYPKLIQDYITTGKARLEFRQFPIIGSNSDGSIDQSGESFMAAEAAVCANDQGKFWPMHDLLYENSVGEFKGSFTIERLKQIAALVPGLDTTAFAACLDGGSHTQDILNSASEATTSGVNSTPTFIVEGQKVSGADYDRLKSVVDAKLAEQ
jgi:protein-disulfide isomerase